MSISEIKEKLLNDEEFMNAIVDYTNKKLGEKFGNVNATKKQEVEK